MLPLGSTGEHVAYKLFAVIFHSGASAAHGHYYCFAKDATSAWQLLNDAVVKHASFNQIEETGKLFPTECAYILCFRRSDEPDADDGTMPDALQSFVS